MLRIVKLTDYATLLLTHLARGRNVPNSAQRLADELMLPVPTVSKILKRLSRAGLVQSTRGANGGYSLSRVAKAISMAEVITAIEGPIALTECALGRGSCTQEKTCSTRPNWQLISHAVHSALSSVSVADMASPMQRSVIIPGLRKE